MRRLASLAHWFGLVVIGARQHDAEVASGTRFEILRDEIHRLRLQVARLEHELEVQRAGDREPAASL